jgi:hypothetical protein
LYHEWSRSPTHCALVVSVFNRNGSTGLPGSAFDGWYHTGLPLGSGIGKRSL